ncbi:cupin domain-containing protein [Paenibacillus sp. Marseille-Q4541]|uniref:cupin domain-containing protein n=1 Tax=Paenibacillus sp. Marseille-Q4541 TaxID=2831522 RepID=UPI001BA946B1|nr:cupin domain-containing protein [Paenibacillus sp. Marseille-Q4541]
MKKDPVLQSPNLNLSADSNKKVNYKRDAHNYITQVFEEQLPAIKTGLFNVHMNKGFIIQPHWHTNVNELVFVISGEVVTSVFDPFTQKLMSYRLKPGQVSMLPLGWFHWIVAMKEDTHVLTIFDEATPDIVYGSDFLRFTPKEIMNLAYCVDEEKYAAAVAPIQESIILGPPPGCKKRNESATVSSETLSSTIPAQQFYVPQGVSPSPQGYSTDGYEWNQAHPFNYYYSQRSFDPNKSY